MNVFLEDQFKNIDMDVNFSKTSSFAVHFWELCSYSAVIFVINIKL